MHKVKRKKRKITIKKERKKERKYQKTKMYKRNEFKKTNERIKRVRQTEI